MDEGLQHPDKTKKYCQDDNRNNDKSPTIKSWVIVQFEGKKTSLHFAGQIMSIENNNNQELL